MPIDRRPILVLLALLASLLVPSAAGAAPGGWEMRGFLAPDFGSPPPVDPSAFGLPPIEVRSLLRMVHLVGLCLGFGTAMVMDGGALVWLRQARAPENAPALLSVGGHVVLLGFALLWASGIALTLLAVEADPAFLTNPKLWAKVVIVTALTANAAVLHARVLPPFAQSLGRRIDGRWRRGERALFVASGAVSSASWVLAFALGVLREWNYAAPFGAILLLWLIGLLMAATAIRLLLPAAAPSLPYRGPDRRRRTAAAPSGAQVAKARLGSARR